MIKVFGPCNPRRRFVGPNLELQPEAPFSTNASTFGEALADYARHFRVSVTPCAELLPGATELKYFVVTGPDLHRSGMFDIHVRRDDTNICPKQDLAFLLRPGDVIEMGMLAC